MAVARSFRDGWLTSLKIDKLRDDSAELFLFRLGLKADKNGVHFGDPELLRAAVYPLQVSRRRLADVTRFRDKCVAAGLLRLWTAADGRPYVQILNFRQRTPNEKPLHPLPPGEPDDTGQEQLGLAEPEPLPSPPPSELNERKESVARAPRTHGKESDTVWQARLREQFPGVNLAAELRGAEAYLKRSRGANARLTRHYFEREWLPRCEGAVSPAASFQATRAVIEPGPDGWLVALLQLYPTCAWAPGGLREGDGWNTLPADVQARVRCQLSSTPEAAEVMQTGAIHDAILARATG